MEPYVEGEAGVSGVSGVLASTSARQTQTYTPDEVGAILRVDGATVKRWAKLGLIKAVHLPQTHSGGRTTIRISQAVLDALLVNS